MPHKECSDIKIWLKLLNYQTIKRIRKQRKKIGGVEQKSSIPKNVREATAIADLSTEKFHFMLALKGSMPINRHSDTYRNAYLEFKKNSKLEVAGVINDASELEIKGKPTYFLAAFDILLE